MILTLVAGRALFHLHDKRDHGGDAAGYMAAMAGGYRSFSQDGPLHLLHLLFRGHLPGSHWMLWPELGLPLLPLVGGDVLVASSLLLVCFYSLLCIYTFLIFLRVAPHPHGWISAASATVLLCGCSWLVGLAGVFLNDLPALCALAAVVYHLQASEQLRRRAHGIALGLWLGFALCVRPLEVGISLLPLLAYVLVSRTTRRQMPRPLVCLLGLATAAAIVILGLGRIRPVWIAASAVPLACVAAVPALWLTARRRLDEASASAFLSYMLAAILSAGFWAGRWRDFHKYALSVTFQSRTNPGDFANPGFDALLPIINYCWTSALAVFCGLVLLALICRLHRLLKVTQHSPGQATGDRAAIMPSPQLLLASGLAAFAGLFLLILSMQDLDARRFLYPGLVIALGLGQLAVASICGSRLTCIVGVPFLAILALGRLVLLMVLSSGIPAGSAAAATYARLEYWPLGESRLPTRGMFDDHIRAHNDPDLAATLYDRLKSLSLEGRVLYLNLFEMPNRDGLTLQYMLDCDGPAFALGGSESLADIDSIEAMRTALLKLKRDQRRRLYVCVRLLPDDRPLPAAHTQYYRYIKELSSRVSDGSLDAWPEYHVTNTFALDGVSFALFEITDPRKSREP